MNEVFYKGGVKLNFKFDKCVHIQNQIKINDTHSDQVETEFWFSNKSIYIASLRNDETGKLHKIIF